MPHEYTNNLQNCLHAKLSGRTEDRKPHSPRRDLHIKLATGAAGKKPGYHQPAGQVPPSPENDPPRHLSPTPNVVGPLGPFPGRVIKFHRKDGKPTGHLDAITSLKSPRIVHVLVVKPGRGINRPGNPVNSNIRQQFVSSEPWSQPEPAISSGHLAFARRCCRSSRTGSGTRILNG